MLYILLALYSAVSIYELSLSLLEYNFVKKAMNRPAVILNEIDYKKAGLACLAKLKFSAIIKIFNLAMVFIWSCFGLALLNEAINSLSQNVRLNGVILVLSFLIIGNIFSLPFSIYEKFILNKKLGFSNITPKIFILDFFKELALLCVFAGLGVWAFSLCYDYLGKFWWIFAYTLAFCIILLINIIYPTLIAPIFNKITPLEDETLKTAISSLLNKCGFKSSGVFVIDASKRDKRLNAYFGGLGSTKRVVLFDTLIEKLSQTEILAVLSHELGHFKHKDMIKNIIMMAVIMLVFFAILGSLNASIYGATGLNESAYSLIIFFMLYGLILEAIFMPIISAFSRSYEFNADSFAAKNTNKNDMILALKKLGSENKAFPLSHPLYSFIYDSHPTLEQRIKKLENS